MVEMRFRSHTKSGPGYRLCTISLRIGRFTGRFAGPSRFDQTPVNPTRHRLIRYTGIYALGSSVPILQPARETAFARTLIGSGCCMSIFTMSTATRSPSMLPLCCWGRDAAAACHRRAPHRKGILLHIDVISTSVNGDGIGACSCSSRPNARRQISGACSRTMLGSSGRAVSRIMPLTSRRLCWRNMSLNSLRRMFF